MIYSNFIDSKSNYKLDNNDICKNLYKGACVKIKNSRKTFQVIGLNSKSKVCWIREWPFALEFNKTFSLEINQITLLTLCNNNFTEK